MQAGRDNDFERLNAALKAAHVGLREWDLAKNHVIYSTEWKRQLGHDEHEISNDFREWQDRLHPDDLQRSLDTIRAYVERPWPNYAAEFRMRHKDGSYRWILAQAALEYDEQGRAVRMLGSHIDITDRKRVESTLREREAELKASEERLRSLTDASPHMIFQLTPEGVVTYANRYWRDYLGRESLAPHEWVEIVHPDDFASAMAQYGSLQATETATPVRLRRHDGSYRWFVSRTVPIFDAAGNLLYIAGAGIDVDDLKRTQDALREAQARLVTALGAARMGTWHYDLHSDRIRPDEPLAHLLGRTSRELNQLSMQEVLSLLVHPDDRKGIAEAVRRTLEEGADLSAAGRAILPDGTTRWHAIEGRVQRDAAGQIDALIGANVDITHRKQLEEQLRQAQKMEAVGQLAGGIAHDFNNLLMVILGQASLLELEPDLGRRVSDSVHAIEHAAQRAAHLTAQLLAFGRRQVLQARDMDLNELLARDIQLLVRTLGEDITCVFEQAPAPALVHVDPSMLTQVLLNLAVNARDAMPHGGRLTIRVCIERLVVGEAPVRAEVPPGEYVCLLVSDTGSGIAEKHLAHLFEPFFTTKTVGQGTGLGLAMVYGIVKQHRGFVHVDTALGKGTTFKVAFPRVEAAPAPASERPRAAFPEGRGETILLVEDEAMVRSLLTTILEQHNYRVIAVETGAQAYEAWRDHGHEVALLLTDLVLPGGTSGYEIAAMLRANKPDLRAILSSGYSAEIFGGEKTSENGARFLQKPYDPQTLLAEVRSALDEPS